MRSAQSRLGVVAALGSASRGAVRCVHALPVPPSAFRIGGAAFAGLAGVVALRGLFSSSSRRKQKVHTVAAVPAAPRRNLGYLLSETALTLLLPLCRRYFLGESGGVNSGNLLAPQSKSER